MLVAVGVLLQLAGVALVATFLLVLRRYAGVGGYFSAWTWGWGAYALAIAAVATRYFVAPSLPLDAAVVTRVCDVVYFGGKLFFFGAIAFGAARFAGWRPRAEWPLATGALYAVFALRSAATLNGFVAWQAPVALLAAGGTTWLLLTVPRGRRSVGSGVVAIACGVLAVLWALYGVAFYASVVTPNAAAVAPLADLAANNSFLDLLVSTLLGFGMATLVLEDAKRTADAAHESLTAAHEALQRSASHDTLTGALNRSAFHDAVVAGHRLAGGAVVVIDLNDLKKVNDALGHAAGDRLLAHLASTVRRALPDFAQLYRWGGDEFVAVIPGWDAERASRNVAAILDLAEPLVVDGETVPLSASLGAAPYADGSELDYAVTRADDAMYRDKTRRKGTPVRPMLAIPVAG